MPDSTKTKTTKPSAALGDLKSAKSDKILAALKSFHTTGNASIVLPILELWKNNPSVEIEKEIEFLLISLKDSSTIQPLMEAYRNDDFRVIKRNLTVVFWNSKLDFSQYLSDFVLFAIEGDFQDTFEALTLIEQFETGLSESTIMESQLLLKEYFGSNENRSEQKDLLLADIALFLKKSEDEADLDDLYLE